MNSDVKMARRYYWISDNVHSTFLSKPHSGIICDKTHHNELDITARDSVETQKTSLDLVKGNPQNLISSIKKLQFCSKKQCWTTGYQAIIRVRMGLILTITMKSHDILIGM